MAGAVVVVAPCAAANRTQSLLSISSCFSFVFVAGTCRSGYALAMATLVAVVVRSTSLLRFIFIVPLLMMIYNLFTFCLLLLRAIVLRLFCDYTLSHTHTLRALQLPPFSVCHSHSIRFSCLVAFFMPINFLRYTIIAITALLYLLLPHACPLSCYLCRFCLSMCASVCVLSLIARGG